MHRFWQRPPTCAKSIGSQQGACWDCIVSRMTDRMAEPGLQWGPGPHLVGERKDKDEGNGVVGSASRMGKNFEPYPLSLLIVKQLRHYITKRQIGRDCSLFKPDAYAESSSGWPSEPTLLTTTDQPNSLFTMRLSSIIVFAVFSLLTSASAIDGYIDSLWKRVADMQAEASSSVVRPMRQAPPQAPGRRNRPVRLRLLSEHRESDGTIIRDYVLRNERLSKVTFKDGLQISFSYTTEKPWDTHDSTHEHGHDTGGRTNEPSRRPTPDFTFNEYTASNMKLRDYRKKKRLMLSSLMDDDGTRLVFYPRPPGEQRSKHTAFTTTEEFVSGTYVRFFFGESGQQVMAFERPADREWEVPLFSDHNDCADHFSVYTDHRTIAP